MIHLCDTGGAQSSRLSVTCVSLRRLLWASFVPPVITDQSDPLRWLLMRLMPEPWCVQVPVVYLLRPDNLPKLAQKLLILSGVSGSPAGHRSDPILPDLVQVP